MNLMATIFDKIEFYGILNVLEGGDSNTDMGKKVYLLLVRMPVILSHII